MRKAPSLVFAFLLVTGIATLASCGGGGGSSTPTTSAPGNPGAPSSSSPSTAPTTSPTSSGAPTPTPTPTGHGGGPTPTPSATPSPTPTATAGFGSSTIDVGYGETNGSGAYPNQNTGVSLVDSSAPNDRGYPGGGNLEPGDKGATTTGGPNGNGGGGQGPVNGGAVDGVSCQPSMSNNYHVHFFLGVYYNGSEVALPAGLGMSDPEPPKETVNGVPNQSWTASCYYDTHTHDNSGMVHVESQNNGTECGPYSGLQNAPPCNYSIYQVGTFLDIWGILVSTNIASPQFGPLQGPVQIYTQADPPPPYCLDATDPCGTVDSNTLSFYSGDPHQIPIYSHTVIWVVVGTPPQSGLPNVHFEEGDP